MAQVPEAPVPNIQNQEFCTWFCQLVLVLHVYFSVKHIVLNTDKKYWVNFPMRIEPVDTGNVNLLFM